MRMPDTTEQTATKADMINPSNFYRCRCCRCCRYADPHIGGNVSE